MYHCVLNTNRSILLKLGSLAVYLFFLVNKQNKNKISSGVHCGETEFGKEMYKLTIFHLLVSFCNTFLVAYPRKYDFSPNCLPDQRKNAYSATSADIFCVIMCISSLFFCHRLLVENCLSSRFLRRVGKPQFTIQLNVLDLVYSQTVSWVGVFYCPLLPAISMFKLLTIFYISKVCLDGVQRSKYTQSLVVENPFLFLKKCFLLFSSSI